MSADSADLVEWGFPARPDDPHHLARYEAVFGRLKGKLNYVPPTFRRNEDRLHRPRTAATSAGTESSTNWSGGVVFAPSGQSFKWVEGDWVVPNVDAPTENQWYYSASWIGIDGDGSGDVCQAGVECEVYRSGSSITRHIYPWWEWFPESEVQVTNLAVGPGDMVTVLICTSGGAGSTSASVYFSNRTTGASTSFAISAPSGTKLVGNCAEWIVEAPTVSGAQSSLADFGEVFFSVCEAVTGAGTTVNGGTGDNINLTNAGGTVSDGKLITANVVQCLYVGTLP
ncbi:MAG: G1 family glutamic endopeptidase [Acidimicrobiales bacterium]